MHFEKERTHMMERIGHFNGSSDRQTAERTIRAALVKEFAESPRATVTLACNHHVTIDVYKLEGEHNEELVAKTVVGILNLMLDAGNVITVQVADQRSDADLHSAKPPILPKKARIF